MFRSDREIKAMLALNNLVELSAAPAISNPLTFANTLAVSAVSVISNPLTGSAISNPLTGLPYAPPPYDMGPGPGAPRPAPMAAGAPAAHDRKNPSDPAKEVMLRTMCECADGGLRYGGDQFWQDAYTITAAEVREQARFPIRWREVRSALAALRKKYRCWLELGEVAGAVWDEHLQQWTLGAAEWDALIARNSDMEQFRGHTLQWPDYSAKLWHPDAVKPTRRRKKTATTQRKRQSERKQKQKKKQKQKEQKKLQ
ncbi:hypothetical protein B0T24DRAFT_693674 [Lasiosphaeria ovina]|uniref:Myb/SANT-like domain-containing protein n=1 Tax=Lasiosphaeria ovina TaxID=92902 RepID=A0AAE0JRG2_9PEZI|nr:hypothetical protein B0T24DRAFT_693674 [Lasiosphaeria ovina]